MFVSIFKTTASNKKDKLSIFEVLRNLGVRLSVTLDLSDEDRVLRVESKKNITGSIIEALNNNKFYCEELGTFLYGYPVKA